MSIVELWFTLLSITTKEHKPPRALAKMFSSILQTPDIQLSIAKHTPEPAESEITDILSIIGEFPVHPPCMMLPEIEKKGLRTNTR